MNLEGYTPGALQLRGAAARGPLDPEPAGDDDAAVTEQLEGYRFSEAARTHLRIHLVGVLRLVRRDEQGPAARRRTAGRWCSACWSACSTRILRLVQPIMPFVAESIWQALSEAAFERGLPAPEPAAESVVIAPWPAFPATWHDPAMETRMARMQEPGAAVCARCATATRSSNERRSTCPCAACRRWPADFQALPPFIVLLAGVGKLECGPDVTKPPQSATT